jgi:hypothetical protein
VLYLGRRTLLSPVRLNCACLREMHTMLAIASLQTPVHPSLSAVAYWLQVSLSSV